MAALAANLDDLSIAPRGRTDLYPVVNADALYRGGLVGLNAGGYLAPWADTAGHEFVGVFEGFEPALQSGVPTTVGVTAATPIVQGRVDISGPKLQNIDVGGVTAVTDVNSLVYGTTDNHADLSLTPGSNVKAVGWLCRFRSTSDMDVQLFTPGEHRGGVVDTDT